MNNDKEHAVIKLSYALCSAKDCNYWLSKALQSLESANLSTATVEDMRLDLDKLIKAIGQRIADLKALPTTPQVNPMAMDSTRQA